MRDGEKRLVVEMNVESHNQIKAAAARRGITIRRWVSRALERALKSEIPITTIKNPYFGKEGPKVEGQDK